MDWMIATTNENRRMKWERVFGCESLPVRHNTPTGAIRISCNIIVPAYELDASRLHPMAAARFAAHLSRRLRISFDEAKGMVDGWMIDASDCEVKTVGEKRPFLPRFIFGDKRLIPEYGRVPALQFR